MDTDIKQFDKLNKRLDSIVANMATKEDLKTAIAPLATKESLYKLATAKEMNSGFGRLRKELADKDDINKVYNAADAFFKQTLTKGSNKNNFPYFISYAHHLHQQKCSQ